MSGDRKAEILRAAIELIADEGYGSLSMRALVRASGMKLGALRTAMVATVLKAFRRP